MKKLKQKVSLTLDPDVIDRIRTIAYRDDLSFSCAVNMLLCRSIFGPPETGSASTESGKTQESCRSVGGFV